MNNGNFQINIRKNFAVRKIKQWKRMPREVVESPAVEVFKTLLDMVLGSLLLLSLLLAR